VGGVELHGEDGAGHLARPALELPVLASLQGPIEARLIGFLWCFAQLDVGDVAPTPRAALPVAMKVPPR
jgi:hypothetical protein